VEAAAWGKHPPPTPPAEPAVARPAGAFVTLRRGPHLRGCIGTFQATEPLHRTVAAMARAAALEDPRFRPVRPEEVAELAIEVSVLTPMRRVRDAGEIEVGRHGLWIVRGHHRGVLLPQVATEYGWSREEFLEHTCRKAGLPPGAWREGADIYVFEAEVFGEGVEPGAGKP
jgi:AmmeMemoRadiSam system protein A